MLTLSPFVYALQFEFLGHCAGLELVTDSCLVNKTINNCMSIHTTNKGARLLQVLSGVNVECSHPKVPEQALHAFMSVAMDQCTELGSAITDEEFVEVVGTFMQLFANKKLWVVGRYPKILCRVFRLLIKEGLQNANPFYIFD